jgi:hypothetical protein
MRLSDMTIRELQLLLDHIDPLRHEAEKSLKRITATREAVKIALAAKTALVGSPQSAPNASTRPSRRVIDER